MNPSDMTDAQLFKYTLMLRKSLGDLVTAYLAGLKPLQSQIDIAFNLLKESDTDPEPIAKDEK